MAPFHLTAATCHYFIQSDNFPIESCSKQTDNRALHRATYDFFVLTLTWEVSMLDLISSYLQISADIFVQNTYTINHNEYENSLII